MHLFDKKKTLPAIKYEFKNTNNTDIITNIKFAIEIYLDIYIYRYICIRYEAFWEVEENK